MGVTFQGYDFPTSNMGKVIFHYSDDSFKIDQVVTILAVDKVTSEQRGLNKITVYFFFDTTENDISDENAYKKMMSFLKELQNKGWTYAHSNSAPMLTPKDNFTFATTEGSPKLYLDYSYPLTFEEWMQLSDLQIWRLKYGTEIYPEIASWRLENETSAIKMDLKIQQDQPDYTLPLVLEKTGIDTSKFVSIDPYKITYEEFMQRQEAGEDMTPYCENQPETKSEITSRITGRCLASQPCPKSG